ncbi:uncharacterized protein DSM5745_05967 [Aspergillus mulundensis]|uniref:Uncharacterized protein n=1 Tax=Aspergillus mulundensis TaxID=1810919 RepID=A0A3D8RYK2_9EURO|nr:hypothetical protein DSM5745_05967 [Aspergillus mulundensis]RDW79115.1 hypothetical protein DSM5745_05967 [Aspergillus mulundensis]
MSATNHRPFDGLVSPLPPTPSTGSRPMSISPSPSPHPRANQPLHIPPSGNPTAQPGLAISEIGQMSFATGTLLGVLTIPSLTLIEPTPSHPASTFHPVRMTDLETGAFGHAASVVPPVPGGIGIGVWWSDMAGGDLLWGVGRVVSVQRMQVPIVLAAPVVEEGERMYRMPLTEEEVEEEYELGDGGCQVEILYARDEGDGTRGALGFR